MSSNDGTTEYEGGQSFSGIGAAMKVATGSDEATEEVEEDEGGGEEEDEEADEEEEAMSAGEGTCGGRIRPGGKERRGLGTGLLTTGARALLLRVRVRDDEWCGRGGRACG